MLDERFAPPSQTESVETLLGLEVGQAICRLANLAYPAASSDIKETLFKDQFVDALVDSEIRIRIKQSRPTNLNEAINLAVELEAYNRAERKSHPSSIMTESDDKTNDTSLSGMLSKLIEKFDNLHRDVDELKRHMTSSPPMPDKCSLAGEQRQIKCYNCHKKGLSPVKERL